MSYRDYTDVFNYDIFKNLKLTGNYNSPVIRATQSIPTKLIGFNNALSCKNPQDYYIHFYIDDYQFERVWNQPTKYINLLKKFAGVIGPDFSSYTDLSMCQRIWNNFRNKVLTAYWQKLGVNVIPNARWIDNDKVQYNNGFDGLPQNSSLAITTNSTQSLSQYLIFKKELSDIILKLKPTNLIIYGTLKEPEKALCKQNNIKVYEFKTKLNELERL